MIFMEQILLLLLLAVVAAVIGWGIVVLIRIVTAPHGTKPATS